MEIEKKYLIKYLPENIDLTDVNEIEQGYLCVNPVVRIRKYNEQYILTYKMHQDVRTKEDTCVNKEVELELTRDSYEHLKEKADGYIISKKRYKVPYNDLIIELDIFSGENEGLIIAEVEFPDIETANGFEPPEWFGDNVSGNKSYTNAYLSSHPYKTSM